MRSSLLPLFVALQLLFAAACGGNGSPDPDAGDTDAGVDTVAPVTGASLTAGNPTSSTIDLTWTAATDETTSASALEYRAYFSEADDLGTVADILANGTEANDWSAGITTLTVGSLALGTTYYFNVLVRDEAGNVSAYGGASATTLGGSWDEEEPVDLGGASAYYSTLSVSSRGDTVMRWQQAPTWEAHYAVRGHDADTFGAELPWGEPGMVTRTVDYGFDDVVVGASTMSNGDDTRDVTFDHLADAEVTRDPIASGIADQYWVVARACVASNGDAMVVWIDGASAGMLAVRARFRAGGTWGTASLVSATETLAVSALDVVCSPDGDHVVFYDEETAGDVAPMARVYDASAGAWLGAAVPLNTDEYRYARSAARTDDGRVVAAWAEHDSATTTSYVVRTLEGGTWSTPADTLATDDDGALGALSIVAAGDDVHAVWYESGGTLVTRRLVSGATSWTTAAPVADVGSFQEMRVSGNRFGDVLLVWASANSLTARLYSAASGAWGTPTPLKEDDAQIGSGSTSAVLDVRRRATVAWTIWDPVAGAMMLRTRTFR